MTSQPAHEQPPVANPATVSADAADATPELNPLLQRPLRQVPDIPVNGVVMGRVVSVTEPAVRVRFPLPGNPDGNETELAARALCALPDDWAERECAMLFENGDPSRPLIVGFLLSTPQAMPQNMPQTTPQPATDRELIVDGETVVIQAATELELRCGESVILLQRDGRIEIRGNYVTSQATATQRLRGGSIHMN